MERLELVMNFPETDKSQVPVFTSSSPDEGENVGVEIGEEVSEQVLSIEEYGKLFKVIIHNDHFTSMDFVVRVLMEYFEKNLDQAYKVMMYVHKNGKAVAGMYSREIAETKIALVKKLAMENEFPLNLTMEKTS